MLRWMVNLTAVLCATALGVGGVCWAHHWVVWQQQVDQTIGSLREIDRAVDLRSITNHGQLNSRGWPSTVDPAWFESLGGVPHNAILQSHDAERGYTSRPWMEIAGPEDSELRHPRVRQAIGEQTAEFWYNPAWGVLRARVPVGISDKSSTELYNRINGTSINSILEAESTGRMQANGER